MTIRGWVMVGVVVTATAGGGWWWQRRDAKSVQPRFQEFTVERGTIQVDIQTTGTVQPQNRLEILPPVAGRVEEILVDEGAKVRPGQILAWMSSNERASLLDAALAKGEAEVEKWKDVYKPVPVVAPLAGTVIARNAEPGQRVSAQAAVFVMSDHLIVKAQVDETDVGRVRAGQQTSIALDAFPGERTPGRVDKIAHEAKTVNNVTIYELDIQPDQVPESFRSGMTGTVTIVVDERTKILTVPVAAVVEKNGKKGVWIKPGTALPSDKKEEGTGPGPVRRSRRMGEDRIRHDGKDPGRRNEISSQRKSRPQERVRSLGTSAEATPLLTPVALGITDNRRVEVLSGLREGQVILVPEMGSPWMQQGDGATNPFSMFGRRGGQGSRPTGGGRSR